MNLNKFKVAVCQTPLFKEKQKILEHAKSFIEESSKNGAQICVLGECFNTFLNTAAMYHSEFLLLSIRNAEYLHGNNKSPTLELLKDLSKGYKTYIIAGLPEIGQDSKLYNSAVVCDPNGDMIAKHRKLHLFDVDVPGGFSFKESSMFTPGKEITTFDTEYGKMGLGICNDLRYPEQSRIMAEQGASVLIFPSAFSLTTGPRHWETLLKARAMDNQVYVIGSSPARFKADSRVYQLHAHSMIVDPLGEVKAKCEEDPSVIYAEINLRYMEEIRKKLIVFERRRADLYSTKAH